MNQTSIFPDFQMLSTLKLVEQIVELTHRAKELLPENCLPYAKELASRLGLETPLQAVFLAFFVDSSDDSEIYIKDFARHFDVRKIKILSEQKHIDFLVAKGAILKRTNDDDEKFYRAHKNLLDALNEGYLPKPKNLKNLTVEEFFKIADEILEDDSFPENGENLKFLMKENLQLPVVQRIKEFELSENDLVMFFATANAFIFERNNGVWRHDVDNFFSDREMKIQISRIARNDHHLLRVNLIEHYCSGGIAVPDRWKLTDFCKFEILQELNLKKPQSRDSLLKFEEIAEKPLFYNEKITKEVEKLYSLLDKNRMQKVLERLQENGMRKGFACLFYGAPGTGKTETVKQLARRTERDIMLVDIPSIRDKWVGETEKNIKNIFDRYNKLAKDNADAPILVFNEADAIFNKRSEETTRAVDKMENAMQNIILQEMENFEGILIATTNLQSSMDAAFERRFLFKIEFDKPSAQERGHIWQAMLPELSADDAQRFAEKYDFSGGQIENIARKRMIANILDETSATDLDLIDEACRTESLSKRNGGRIGFGR